ncbi:MAB_1171c family putative transporter [Actinokineospora inagensis]|uniref:MAB_1171c family putative transporter n=1 Tax=Actinokineospora inagensis TaxID=103730 RepID=UPI000413A1B2|nr:MAB_1171c family putative transporter [Actinokineospora inagensis]
MTTSLHVGCVVLGVLVLIPRLAGLLRRPGDLLNTALCGYIALSALGFVVLLPPVGAWVDGVTGVANAGGLVSVVCVFGLTGAQQLLLAYWTHPPEQARRQAGVRLALTGLLTVVFVVMFFLLRPRVQRFHDFYVSYTHQISQAPYLLVYLFGCLAGQLDVLCSCVRFARIADRPALRRGMWTTAAGAAVILVYGAVRTADVVAGQFDVDLRSWEPVAWLCSDIGSALALLGWTIPTLGGQARAIREWVRDYRMSAALYPLWWVLQDAVPSVALIPPVSRARDLARVRNLGFWLHRRVVEIQDGLRAIRPRVDAARAELAAGGCPTGLAAAIATAELRAGPPPTDGSTAEYHWLVTLAREFRAPEGRSPAVVE